MVLRILLLAALAAIVAGCGVGPPPVQAGTLGSVAGEGVLLAQGVVRGETTETFTRVHAEELAAQARTVAGATEVGDLRSLATSLAVALDELAGTPDDRRAALRVERRLRRLAERAKALS